jgi:hypothetical protein
MIGTFPSLSKLIDEADAIVIIRVDHSDGDFGSPTLYSTHDCYVYQTLKGNIPKNKRIRLQLMDTRTSAVSPFAFHSTHLVFLTKKRSPDEATEFRTIEIQGATIALPPTGNEQDPAGETVADKIRSIVQRASDYNEKKNMDENTFLRQMIDGKSKAK